MSNLPRQEPDDGDAQARIIAAAVDLVVKGGVSAATNRAVAQAAGVQPPAIYRLFGDKDGLLNAVAQAVFRRYVAGKKRATRDADPVQQFREGWDQHIAFGLAHPSVFVLVNGVHEGAPSPAWEDGLVVLREYVRNLARTGRMKVSEERAVALIQSMGSGTVLTLLRTPPKQRAGLSEAACAGALALVLDEAKPKKASNLTPQGLAAALRTHVADLALLTPGERLLMDELLRRIAASKH